MERERTLFLERQRAYNLARNYRRQGYEVIEEPSGAQIPDFLGGYRPAMILRRGRESVVVDVKSRSSLIEYPRMKNLAGIIQSHPGWSYELALVATGEQIDIPQDSRSFTREEIVSILEETERLLDIGFAGAALLRGWAAAEATLRMIAEEEGLSPEKAPSMHILQMAVTEGLVSKDDYDTFVRILERRNAYAHGFTPPDFDAALVEELIRTTKRVLYMELELEPRSAYAD